MKLQELLKESFGLKDSQYNDDQSIVQLEHFDSMNHMVFITNLEEGFNIELTGDEIVNLMTIKDIKEILKVKGVTEF